MIKFQIFKGEKDESGIVFIKKDDSEKQRLVFDSLKNMALELMIKAINGEDASYEIETSDLSLEPYKEIVNTVFESVIKDEELKQLYQEANKPKDEEDSNENL